MLIKDQIIRRHYYPLSTIGFRSSILANSADPDATFDQRLHCWVRQKRMSVKEYIFSRKYYLLPLNIQLLAIVYNYIVVQSLSI